MINRRSASRFPRAGTRSASINSPTQSGARGTAVGARTDGRRIFFSSETVKKFFIVPRGVEPRPVAEGVVEVLLFEPGAPLNTGNVRESRTVDAPERI